MRHHSHGELHYFTTNSIPILKNNKIGNSKFKNGINDCVNGNINTSPSGTALPNTIEIDSVAITSTELLSGGGCFKNEIQSLRTEIEKSRYIIAFFLIKKFINSKLFF